MKRAIAFAILFLCTFFVAHVQAEDFDSYFYALYFGGEEMQPLAWGSQVDFYPEENVFKITNSEETMTVNNDENLVVLCEAGRFEVGKNGSLKFVIDVFNHKDLKVNNTSVKVDWMRDENGGYYSTDVAEIEALAEKYGFKKYLKGVNPFYQCQ